MPNVTVIPATRNLHTGVRNDAVAKRKTAGYARVSTDSEEQLTSYEAQVDYYTNYIKSRPEWEFVNVYTDEGISATDTRHRSGFNQMVQDALNALLEGRTSIVIAHRLSTIQGADKIVVVAEGRIAEQGTHDELLARGGIYAHLIEMQSFA